MTKDEALRMALEALDNLMYWDNGKPEYDEARDAITAIREALANVATNDTSKERVDEMQKQRHEQEPVVGTKTWFEDGKVVTQYLYPSDIYTTPPQRTWVGLTNNDLQPIAEEYRILFGSWVHDFARAIEAKLKEKNT